MLADSAGLSKPWTQVIWLPVVGGVRADEPAALGPKGAGAGPSIISSTGGGLDDVLGLGGSEPEAVFSACAAALSTAGGGEGLTPFLLSSPHTQLSRSDLLRTIET